MGNYNCLQSAKQVDLPQWKHINLHLRCKGLQFIPLKWVSCFENIDDTLVENI